MPSVPSGQSQERVAWHAASDNLSSQIPLLPLALVPDRREGHVSSQAGSWRGGGGGGGAGARAVHSPHASGQASAANTPSADLTRLQSICETARSKLEHINPAHTPLRLLLQLISSSPAHAGVVVVVVVGGGGGVGGGGDVPRGGGGGGTVDPTATAHDRMKPRFASVADVLTKYVLNPSSSWSRYSRTNSIVACAPPIQSGVQTCTYSPHGAPAWL